MAVSGKNNADRSIVGAEFHTTHWSLVLAAGREECPQATEALEQLCRTYWYPLYAYVRRRGHDRHAAEDLTQAFFARLLEKKHLRQISREGGLFRSYLLTALNHFLANEWARAQAQKRGGDQIHFSIDHREADSRYALELEDTRTPESLFERRWALTLLDQVLARLREEHADPERSRVFDHLQIYLSGDKNLIPHATVAASLGISESAVKVAIHRLRKRYGALLRQETARTVATPEDVTAEIRHLQTVLGR